MITHDVDEAVLLSDRIVMMTNGPSARIGEGVLEVPLARRASGSNYRPMPRTLNAARVLEFLYERHRFVERPSRCPFGVNRWLSSATEWRRASGRRADENRARTFTPLR